MKRLQATQEEYKEESPGEKIYSSSMDIRSFTRPLNVVHAASVPFELIFAHLFDNGKVASNDFLAQARLALQTATVEDLDQVSSR
jgi:hypothetical protein